MRRGQRVRVLRAALGLPAGSVVATSAQSGFGITDLWRAIDARVAGTALEGESAPATDRGDAPRSSSS